MTSTPKAFNLRVLVSSCCRRASWLSPSVSMAGTRSAQIEINDTVTQRFLAGELQMIGPFIPQNFKPEISFRRGWVFAVLTRLFDQRLVVRGYNPPFPLIRGNPASPELSTQYSILETISPPDKGVGGLHGQAAPLAQFSVPALRLSAPRCPAQAGLTTSIHPNPPAPLPTPGP